MIRRPTLNEILSEILLEKVKPKLKHTFNEKVFIEDTPPYDDVKGSRYYITAYVIDKRTLESELNKYIDYIKEASKYLINLSKIMTQHKVPSIVWLSPYTKLFKKGKKVYRQFEDEPPEQRTINQALEYVKDQIKHYQHVLSISFIESIGKDTYDTLVDTNSFLLQRSKIGIGFFIANGISDTVEGRGLIEEALENAINGLNKKAEEYYNKISSKVYNRALSEFKKLSSNIIRIPKVKQYG